MNIYASRGWRHLFPGSRCARRAQRVKALTLTNATLVRNQATSQSGAIYASYASASATLQKLRPADNSAGSSGGAIYQGTGAVDVT